MFRQVASLPVIVPFGNSADIVHLDYSPVVALTYASVQPLEYRLPVSSDEGSAQRFQLCGISGSIEMHVSIEMHGSGNARTTQTRPSSAFGEKP
jgi:hypothetical protein